jgi:hypothetical protein
MDGETLHCLVTFRGGHWAGLTIESDLPTAGVDQLDGNASFIRCAPDRWLSVYRLASSRHVPTEEGTKLELIMECIAWVFDFANQ